MSFKIIEERFLINSSNASDVQKAIDFLKEKREKELNLINKSAERLIKMAQFFKSSCDYYVKIITENANVEILKKEKAQGRIKLFFNPNLLDNVKDQYAQELASIDHALSYMSSISEILPDSGGNYIFSHFNINTKNTVSNLKSTKYLLQNLDIKDSVLENYFEFYGVMYDENLYLMHIESLLNELKKVKESIVNNQIIIDEDLYDVIFNQKTN